MLLSTHLGDVCVDLSKDIHREVDLVIVCVECPLLHGLFLISEEGVKVHGNYLRNVSGNTE